MEFAMYLALVLIGACMGSFAGATVWRLRARQLVRDKKNHEAVSGKEFNKLEKLAHTKLSKDRSRCLHCDYTLKWYDLIPVISWLSLKGKCRNCHKPIGYFELIIELGVIAFFVVSFALWPFTLDTGLEIARFIIWLASGVVLAMLFSYDAKWFLLPDRLTIVLAILGVSTAAITAVQSGNAFLSILSALGSVAILSGLYLGLYLISKGKWVGFGDVKLGVGLALLLVDWQLALVALFFANLIGTLIVIPGLMSGKLKRSSRVPFGPLLILGAVLAQFIGPAILSFYVGTLI
jgi:prepilin signal peptidase PulO-like enzyme (type II secretory pathway)